MSLPLVLGNAGIKKVPGGYQVVSKGTCGMCGVYFNFKVQPGPYNIYVSGRRLTTQGADVGLWIASQNQRVIIWKSNFVTMRGSNAMYPYSNKVSGSILVGLMMKGVKTGEAFALNRIHLTQGGNGGTLKIGKKQTISKKKRNLTLKQKKRNRTLRKNQLRAATLSGPLALPGAARSAPKGGTLPRGFMMPVQHAPLHASRAISTLPKNFVMPSIANMRRNLKPVPTQVSHAGTLPRGFAVPKKSVQENIAKGGTLPANFSLRGEKVGTLRRHFETISMKKPPTPKKEVAEVSTEKAATPNNKKVDDAPSTPNAEVDVQDATTSPEEPSVVMNLERTEVEKVEEKVEVLVTAVEECTSDTAETTMVMEETEDSKAQVEEKVR